MSRPDLFPMSNEELTTAWNAMEYAFVALDGDMSLDTEERAELQKLGQLKDRFKAELDAQQSSQEDNG